MKNAIKPRSRAPVTVRFVDSHVATKIGTSFFAGAFAGKEGEVVWRKQSHTKDAIELFVGLGEKPSLMGLAKATHAAMRRARQLDRQNVTLMLPTTKCGFEVGDVSMLNKLMALPPQGKKAADAAAEGKAEKLSAAEVAEKLAQFSEMSAYEWTRMKTGAGNAKAAAALAYKANVTVRSSKVAENKKFAADIRAGKQIGEAVNAARDFANLRPDIGTPTYFANLAKKFARQNSGSVRMVAHISGEQLRKRGHNLHYSVGKASQDAPALIVLEYRGDKANSDKKIALVGKTLVMDTGGLNVKPFGHMETMHLDKGGGAATYGAFVAAVNLKLKVNLVLALGAANNAIAGNALQPSEIITSLKGTTVEVTNTECFSSDF